MFSSQVSPTISTGSGSGREEFLPDGGQNASRKSKFIDMSNLSDIGFPTKSNEELNDLVERWLRDVTEIRCPKGTYLTFSDPSGAQIYLQMDTSGEFTGLNPYYAGSSRRRVYITGLIERDSSPLDGGLHAWANAEKEDEGDYPFVFDVPDIFTAPTDFPKVAEIQLNAFATNDLEMFETEDAFFAAQAGEPKFAAQSFIPIGLFRENDGIPPQAHGRFAGQVKDFARKTNHLTGTDFYWFLVETLGGEIDVVSDPNYVKIEPRTGAILSGSFWLTGRIRPSAENIQTENGK
jgi:hypothetical protein